METCNCEVYANLQVACINNKPFFRNIEALQINSLNSATQAMRKLRRRIDRCFVHYSSLYETIVGIHFESNRNKAILPLIQTTSQVKHEEEN